MTTVIEPTSGNTGIALAFVCAAKGYRCILTMPQGMSREREALVRLYGAEAIVTESMGGMHEAVDEAMRLAREIEDSFVPQQFENPANPEMHRRTTAEEIWADLGRPRGRVRGGRGHRRDDHRRRRGAEGAQPGRAHRGGGAGQLAGAVRGRPGPHRIQGIGAGFVPPILNRDVIDEIIQVTDDDAIDTATRSGPPGGSLGRDLGRRGDLGVAPGSRAARVEGQAHRDRHL